MCLLHNQILSITAVLKYRYVETMVESITGLLSDCSQASLTGRLSGTAAVVDNLSQVKNIKSYLFNKMLILFAV